MNAQAYTPPPAARRIVWNAARRNQTGAVVAALAATSVFFGWLHAKRKAPAQVPVPLNAPEQTQAPEAISEPAVSVSVAPVSAPVGVTPLPAQSLFKGRAWTASTPAAAWAWPRGLHGFEGQVDSGAKAKAGRTTQTRRLIAWTPAAAKGEQLLFARVNADGTETRYFEGQNPDVAPIEESVSPGAPKLTTTLKGVDAYAENVGKGMKHFVENPEIRRAREAAAARQAALDAREMNALMAALTAAMAGPVAQLNAVLQRVRAQARANNERIQKAVAAGATVHMKAVAGPPSADGSPNRMRVIELKYPDGRVEQIPAMDPLVFDLKGRGVQTADKKALFDLKGEKRVDRVQWMNDFDEGTGLLVVGAGSSGAELFGDRTDLAGAGRPDGYADGFEALRALAEKAAAKGVISRDALDSGLLDAASLKALETAYGLKMKVGGFHGRTISLAEAGVASISLSREPARRVSDFDGRGNDLSVQPGAVFTRADGSTGHYMNAWLAAKTGNLGLAE